MNTKQLIEDLIVEALSKAVAARLQLNTAELSHVKHGANRFAPGVKFAEVGPPHEGLQDVIFAKTQEIIEVELEKYSRSLEQLDDCPY